MALSRPEITKDVVEQCTQAALGTAGQVSTILFDAARRITAELGAFGTEVFEIVEASRRAHTDETHPHGP